MSITWLALSNVDVGKMQRRAGHDSLETTMGYVKAAEDLSGAAGQPFPALPAGLLWPSLWTRKAKMHGEKGRTVAPAQGFERRNLESTCENLEKSGGSSLPEVAESVRKVPPKGPGGPDFGPQSDAGA